MSTSSIFAHELADPAIELTLVSDPAVKAKGTVREISPTVDKATGTVRAKVGIEHPPAAMTLRAAVIGEGRLQPRKLAVVPWSALSSGNGQPAVWTVDPQTRTVSLRPITIEGYETGKILVREGLQPGEVVVTGGAQFLRPTAGCCVHRRSGLMNSILTSVAALGTAGLLVACQEQQHAEAPAPRPVLTVAVAPQTARTLGFAGTVEPRYKSDLGFRVLGRIISRDVDVGDIVKKGQRLATLDPLTYQLAVRSAQADLASATARLENAAATEARQRTLLRQNVATQAQYDAAKEALETAEASVNRAKAELEKAKERLSYTELSADFDGVVTAVAGGTRAGGPAGADGRHGGSPGHPRGRARPA